VGKVVLGQVSLQVAKFSPVSIITPMLYIHIYSSVFDIMQSYQLTASLNNHPSPTRIPNISQTVCGLTCTEHVIWVTNMYLYIVEWY